MRNLASNVSSIDQYNGFGHQLWDLAGSFPSLDLRFALEKSLKNAVDGSDVVTFSRSSAATFINSSGNIETAAVNVPRFDHDPVTGECLGLLIEPSSNNYFNYSAGSKLNYGLTSHGTFTDLTLNALGVFPGILIQSDGTSGAGITSNFFAYPSSNKHVFTVWMKDDGTAYPSFQMGLNDYMDSAFKYAHVQYNSGDLDNINSYSVINSDTFGYGEISLVSVKNVGDNVIKIVFTFSKGPGAFGFENKAYVYQLSTTVGEAITFLGWQLEMNRQFASSYIPTSGSLGARSTDLATITGTNFSSWYENNEGTAFAEAEFFDDTVNLQCLYGFSGNNTDNEIIIYKQPNSAIPQLSNKLKTNIRKDANGIFGTTFSDIQFDQKIKTIFTFKNDHVNTAVGSSVGTTDTSITLPTVNQLTLAQRKDGHYSAAVYLNRFTFWPKKISDTGLKAATGNPIDTTTVGPSSNSSPVGEPVVNGTLQEGYVLTASVGTIKDYDQLNTNGNITSELFSYQWRSDGVAIEGATSNQYTLTSNEVGKTMSVVVSFTDDFGNNETLISNETEAVAESSALDAAVFEFKYHDYGQHIIGEKLVFWETTTSSAAANSSTRYNLIWERDTSLFPANTSQTANWKRVQLDLGSLIDKTGKFIFLHKIGYSFYGDFAIDRWIFTPRVGSVISLSYTDFLRAAAVNDMESLSEITAATNIATATSTETTTFSTIINKQWSYKSSGGNTGSSNTGPNNGASAGSDNTNESKNRPYIYFEASGSAGFNENEWSPLITSSSYSL